MMASSTSRQHRDYQLVGSGHGVCIKQALNDWFTKESFANVVFMCKATGRRELYKLHANASVLAAASSLFKTLLLEKCTTSEQETVILLPDYNHAAVFYALEYMYTGVISLSASKNQIEEVKNLLKEFGLDVTRNLETNTLLKKKTDSDAALSLDDELTETNNRHSPRPENTKLPSKPVPPSEAKDAKVARSVKETRNITTTVYADRAMTFSSGPKITYRRDEPLNYDPSPQYLRQVPMRQYTRKKNMDPKPAAEKPQIIHQEKVHVSSDDTLRAIPSSSIFADPEDGPGLDEAGTDEPAGVQGDGKSNGKKSKRKLGKNVSCDVCGKVVRDKWLKYHKKTHEVHQHVCEKCGRSYALRTQLNTHLRFQHGELVNQYPCPHCDRVFRTSKARRHHVTLHTGERRFKCKYCDERFRDRQVRQCHVRTHTGEKPNLCEICGKRFNQKSTLVKHRRRHELRKGMNGYSASGQPCYKCDQCPAEFLHEISLVAHRAKHTGEVPVLPCTGCPSVFTTFADLRAHRRKTHGLKRYFCQPCQKQFMANSSYNKHMREEHGKEKRQYNPRPVALDPVSATETVDSMT